MDDALSSSLGRLIEVTRYDVRCRLKRLDILFGIFQVLVTHGLTVASSHGRYGGVADPTLGCQAVMIEAKDSLRN